MKELRSVFVFIVLVLIVLFYNSCSDDTVSNSSPYIDPTILRVDSSGQILGGDTTDWCYHGGNGVMFAPVYPNPVVTSFKWNMSLPQGDTIKMYFLKSQQDTFYIFNEYKAAGVYEIRFDKDSTFFHNATRRLYFSAKIHPNTDPYCRYYGDVQFY